jgi:hypothetical protein
MEKAGQQVTRDFFEVRILQENLKFGFIGFRSLLSDILELPSGCPWTSSSQAEPNRSQGLDFDFVNHRCSSTKLKPNRATSCVMDNLHHVSVCELSNLCHAEGYRLNHAEDGDRPPQHCFCSLDRPPRDVVSLVKKRRTAGV